MPLRFGDIKPNRDHIIPGRIDDRWAPAGKILPDMKAQLMRPDAQRLAVDEWRVGAPIAVGDDAVLRDFDTMESLATLPPKLRPAVG